MNKLFWVTKVGEYGVHTLNFPVRVDWTTTRKARKYDPDNFFLYHENKKMLKIIFISGLAIDTVLEVGFNATYCLP